MDFENDNINLLKTYLESFQKSGFSTRENSSIHDPESIAFHKSFLYTDQWTIELLTYGLKLDCVSEPPP